MQLVRFYRIRLRPPWHPTISWNFVLFRWQIQALFKILYLLFLPISLSQVFFIKFSPQLLVEMKLFQIIYAVSRLTLMKHWDFNHYFFLHLIIFWENMHLNVQEVKSFISSLSLTLKEWEKTIWCLFSIELWLRLLHFLLIFFFGPQSI